METSKESEKEPVYVSRDLLLRMITLFEKCRCEACQKEKRKREQMLVNQDFNE